MSLFDTSKKFGFVHVELSEKCNAACPMCMHPKLKAKGVLTNKEISVQDFISVFKDIIYDIEEIWMCGNYSDPMVHSKVYELCEWILETSPETGLRINTNAATRSKKYWSKLGALFAKHDNGLRKQLGIVASIDGLEDTNEIYRVGCNFNKAIENCKAFIDAGGNASWKYIIFEHNEHQVQEARAMADELGFYSFTDVASSRFEQQPITMYTDKNGKLKQINPPKQNELPADLKKESSCIDCHATKRNEFFVDDKGVVMPCCWMAGRIARSGEIGDDNYSKQVWKKYPNLLSELSAIDNNIYDIFNHPFWDDLKLLWTINSPGVCVSKCMKKSRDIHHQTKPGEDDIWREV